MNSSLLGTLTSSKLGDVISDNLVTEIIKRNTSLITNKLKESSMKDTTITSYIRKWWNEVKIEYINDEIDMFKAYARIILLNWTNKIIFCAFN